MFPTLGRIVHWTNIEEPPKTYPAIIVSVDDAGDAHGHKHECGEHCAKVGLTVFCPGLVMYLTDAPFSTGQKSAHWSWPPPRPLGG